MPLSRRWPWQPSSSRAVATPAAAAPPTTYASVRATDRSFSGSVSIGWRLRPYSLDPVTISVQDDAPDGYAIGARLITNGDNGHIAWRLRTIPSGQDTATWTTYAEPGGYISNAYIEVCKIKVSTGGQRLLPVLGCDERSLRRLLRVRRTD